MLKIGHRGACGYQPENTMLSFSTAVALGADAIEFDVRRTKDNSLVVFHDPSVKRTTGDNRLVCDYSLSELQKLDAGKEERIPTLAKVCEVFGKKVILNIELKESGIADQALTIIEKYDLVSSVVLSAFARDENDPGDSSNWTDLFWLKTKEKRLRIALLARKEEWANNALLAARTAGHFPVYGLNFSSRVVSPALVKTAREETDCKLMVWTCNDLEEIQHFKKLGVDGIFSDYPDRLQ